MKDSPGWRPASTGTPGCTAAAGRPELEAGSGPLEPPHSARQSPRWESTRTWRCWPPPDPPPTGRRPQLGATPAERRLPLRADASPAAPRGRLRPPAHPRPAPLAPLTIGRLGPLRLALLAALSSRRPRGPPPSPSAAGLGRFPPPRAMGCRGPRLGGEWRAAEAGCANPPPPSPRSPPPPGPWLPRRPAPSPPRRPLFPPPHAPPAPHGCSAPWPP